MSQTQKQSLFGLTLTQLQALCTELALPRFAAKQIARWLYVRRVESIEQMTDLSKAARAALEERYELGLSAPLKESCSVDGTKYLFHLAGQYIESAYIPDGSVPRCAYLRRLAAVWVVVSAPQDVRVCGTRSPQRRL